MELFIDMTNTALFNAESIHYIKYMGSKTKILPFVISGIEEVLHGDSVCDLFAGSCSLSGALKDQITIISNDIQKYSSIIAKTYLTDWNDHKVSLMLIIKQAQQYFDNHYKEFVKDYQYDKIVNIESFNIIEKKSQTLINHHFSNEWHLFIKNYSGTWWSTEQCAWIDSLRHSINNYKDSSFYNTLLSSLMYAMAYSSQGTGHYAQYRDANTESSMNDILIYRKKNIVALFEKKAKESIHSLPTQPRTLDHQVLSEDYLECLQKMNNVTIYADPPYCFVHYSRFYHALETIVLYDYPEIQKKNGLFVKGRYREDRHQSPFCIRTKVKSAFDNMFSLIKKNGCSLVLSYSDTGMITIEGLLELAYKYFDKDMVSIKYKDYAHMTMGRKNDRTRDVKEMLLLVKHSNNNKV